MAINFNTNPYYDDFDETKNYQRILFKPGYAVQARELTQLQTQLSDQIAKFGKHIFVNGSLVLGGGRLFDAKVISLKINPTYQNAAVDPTLFVGKVIVGESSGVKASIKLAIPATAIDPLTFIVKVIDAGDDGDSEFDPSERIYTDDANAYSANLISGTFQNNAMSMDIDSGIFFINGNFVYLPAQTIAIDKYSNTSSHTVGLEIVEKTITSDDDDTMLDASQGTSNYTAPGADRYQISIDLISKSTIASGNIIAGNKYKIVTLGNTDFTLIGAEENAVNTEFIATAVGAGTGTVINVVDNFVEIARVVDGELVVNVNKTVYSEIGKELARRTFDESGDYTVRKFPIQIEDNDDDADLFDVNLDPGKGYIKGYEFETTTQETIVLDRGRNDTDYQTATAQDISVSHGNYVWLTNLSGAILTNSTYTSVELHSTTKTSSVTGSVASTTLTVTAVSSGILTVGTVISNAAVTPGSYITVQLTSTETDGSLGGKGTYTVSASSSSTGSITIAGRPGANSKLGTARVKYLKIQDGDTPGTSAQYKTYLFNIVMDSGKVFNNVNSIITNPGTYTLGGTIDVSSKLGGDPKGSTFLEGTDSPSLVFNFPNQFIRGVDATTDYRTQRTYTATVSDGAGTIPQQTSSTTQKFIGATGGGGVSPSDKRAHYHVVDKDGVIYDMNGGTIELSAHSTGVAQTLNINHPSIPNGSVTVIASVNENDVGYKSKTLSAYTKKRITSPSTTFGGTKSLEVSDVYDVKYVYNTGSDDPSSVTIDSSGEVTAWTGVTTFTDVTSNYQLDDGQRDDIYDHGNIILVGDAPASTDNLLVIYRNFSHGSTQGFLVKDSYPVEIAYEDIPVFTSPTTGNVYNLRDCIDFRPYRAAGSTSLTTGSVPDPADTVDVNYTFWMGRFDKIIATSDKQFVVQRGISALNPKVPADLTNGMTLYVLAIPPFCANVRDIEVKFIDNKRYTMRDIGRLEKRISNLEYYTQLSLLEKQAKDTSIPDASNLEKFKNGFAVDPFTSQDIFVSSESAWSERRWGWWTSWFNGATTWNDAARNYSSNSIADPANIDFNCAVDPINAELRAAFTVENHLFDYSDDKGGADNTYKDGELVSLEYTELDVIRQTQASGYVNINPYDVIRFLGSITLEPPFDNWVETKTLPAVNKIVDVRMPDAADKTVDIFTGSGNAVRITSTTAATVTNVLSSSTASLGTSVVDIQAIPYIRANTIFGAGKAFKPKARHYPFVEGKTISSYCRPMTRYVVEGHTGALFDDTEGVFETVSFRYGSPTGPVYARAKVALYSDPLTTDATKRILQVFDEKAVGSPVPAKLTAAIPEKKIDPAFARLIGPAFRRWSRSRVRALHLVSGVTYTITELGTTDWISLGATPAAQVTATVNKTTLTVTAVTSGTLAVGQTIYGTGILENTRITRQLTGRGGVGTYRISRRHSSLSSRTIKSLSRGATVVLDGAVGLATLSGTTMTVSSVNGGTFKVGQTVTGTGITTCTISALGTGTGGAGTYTLSVSQPTLTSRAIVARIIPTGTGEASADATETTPVIAEMITSSNIYLVGDRGGYAKYVSKTTGGALGSPLIADEYGNLGFEFQMPADIFKTGERTIRLIDNAANDIEAQDSIGEAKYTAIGTLQSKQETFLTTRTLQNQKVTTRTGVRYRTDPTAQTFFVEELQYPQGFCVTSVDVFFKTKSSRIPVTLQIRRTVNGYPASDHDIPFAEVIVRPSDVSISDDASAATRFQFKNPIHLVAGEYALVLLANSTDYEVFIAEMAKTLLGSQARIDKQPYIGSLFASQNASTWTADQNKDLKFIIRRAEFQNSGNAYFNIQDPDAIKDYHTLNIRSTATVPSGTSIRWYAKTMSDSSIYDTDWTEVNINQDINFTSLRRLAGTTDDLTIANAGSFVIGKLYTIVELGTTDWNIAAGTTGVAYIQGMSFTAAAIGSGTGQACLNTLQLKAVMTSTDATVSPIIDSSGLGIIAALNTINPETYNSAATCEITSGSNIIEFVPDEVFQNINIGMTISGAGTGATISGTVTGYDSYAKEIYVSANASADAVDVGLALSINEEQAAGGGALARYITKPVNLASGFEATNICVTVDINKPSGTDVKCYYKISTAESTTPISDELWVEMDLEQAIGNSVNDFDFREHRFFPAGAFDNFGTPSDVGPLSKFNAFQIKLVLLSSTKHLTPRLRDFRAIALDS
jgi:hypothetical protein